MALALIIWFPFGRKWSNLAGGLELDIPARAIAIGPGLKLIEPSKIGRRGSGWSLGSPSGLKKQYLNCDGEETNTELSDFNCRDLL